MQVFSQSTSKKQDSITLSKPALILIKKDLQYCDSVKLSYEFLRKELQTITESNIELYKEIGVENQKNIELLAKIESLEKDIKKNGHPNRMMWFGAGAGIGVITVLVIKSFLK